MARLTTTLHSQHVRSATSLHQAPEQCRLCGKRTPRTVRRHQVGKTLASAAAAAPQQTLIKKERFATWTNREGKVLTQFSDNVWAAERPFLWNTIDVNGRSAIIRLSDGSLWVHSPAALDPELKAAVDALGPVKHIVSPNLEHVSFAQQWIDAYPDATALVCPGGKDKLAPKITYTGELPRDNAAPSGWLGEVRPVFLGYEAVPVLRKPFFNEVVFVHLPSRTLMTTDLYWNYPNSGTPKRVQAWKFGMDRVYLPFYKNFMVQDKGMFTIAMRRLLDELDWDAILPCHGDHVPRGGKAVLRRHLGLP